MKNFLAPIACLAAVVCQAQTAPGGQSAAEVRQPAAQKPSPNSSFAPRQLSVQERAELRRQLMQYGRAGGGKGS